MQRRIQSFWEDCGGVCDSFRADDEGKDIGMASSLGFGGLLRLERSGEIDGFAGLFLVALVLLIMSAWMSRNRNG